MMNHLNTFNRLFMKSTVTGKESRKCSGFMSGECGGQSKNLLLYSAVFVKTLISHVLFTSSSKTWNKGLEPDIKNVALFKHLDVQ